MVIYEVAANEYEKMSDLAHGLKKMACKLAKCLENLEEQGEEEDYDEDYEDDEEYDQPQYRSRGLRYREPMDPNNTQDPNGNAMVDDPNGNRVMRTRRGRNSRGQYTSMRNRGKRMPRSRYDIEVY